MKKLCVMMLGAITLLTGCFTSDIGVGSQVDNVPVVMRAESKGRLLDAVILAANCRHWQPNKISDTTVRCTIRQRSNFVVVDVIIAPDGMKFSIHGVESNLTIAKYNQWVNNLQREIVKQASIL